MKYLYSFLLICLLTACSVAALNKQHSSGINKFSDENIQRIYALQDERKFKELVPYLQHKKPVYRQEAALALASVQEKSTISDLIKLLTDKETLVRQAAAYALGQIGDATAEEALMKQVASEKTPVVLAEATEALGKCATQKGLDYLVNFNTTDQEIKAGQAWGIYRTNAKGLNYVAAAKKATELLATGNAQPVRLAVAHFLARTPNLDLSADAENLLKAAESDPSPYVRMAAVLALAKVKNNQAPQVLRQLVHNDPDYRVRINAIRALSKADFKLIKNTVFAALRDNNTNTALAAADFLLAQAPLEEAALLFNQAAVTINWRVRATLLAAALQRHPAKVRVSNHIQQLYSATDNIYEKGSLLTALGQEVANYKFIQQETFNGNSPVLVTYGIQALADMRKTKSFPADLKAPFAIIFRKAIESEDVAVVGIVAGLLQNPDLAFKQAYPDWQFLKTVRDKLVLPRDMETYQELAKTIQYFEGSAPTANPQNPYNHPIDWALVKQMPPQQQVLLNTDKGAITLQLFTEAAPGTVANFVQLAQQGFFNNKPFHRVVPNFVVQGGDPRGDGWGGTDYSIRSEFAYLRYNEGYIGMASAGKDTESCQWFITHSPTPHLDGRYTIFARVIAGMDVVHQLAIGDKINSVKML